MLIGIAFMAAALAVVGFVAYRGKKRTDSFIAGAAARGWNFQRRNNAVLRQWAGSGDIFNAGHNRRARNIVSGSNGGREFVSFDYSYVTSDGKNSQTHRFGVLALDMRQVFPALAVSPEHVLGRLWGSLTNTDIQFESEDFNRAFTVRCPERKFASDVINPATMSLMLEHRELGWRFHQNFLLSVKPGAFSFPEVEARLAVLEAITGNIPAFVGSGPDGSGGASRAAGTPEGGSPWQP